MVPAKPFLSLTAAELMSRDVIVVSQSMSLRAAGQLLSQSRISGAPVVDEQGQFVGVLSVSDFVQRVLRKDVPSPAVPTRGECVCSEWQVVEPEGLPTEEVRTYMTRDPVTVSPTTPIDKLARMMLDAHIHRVIVVDSQSKPIGVVSSTDILAAVAAASRSIGEI